MHRAQLELVPVIQQVNYNFWHDHVTFVARVDNLFAASYYCVIYRISGATTFYNRWRVIFEQNRSRDQ